jgi:hypothetical protein
LYQPAQSTDLFQQLFYLLNAHAETWAGAAGLLAGFQRAAATLGMVCLARIFTGNWLIRFIGVIVNTPTSTVPLATMPDSSTPKNGTLNAAFPFDPTLFFGLDFQEEWALN